MIVISEVVDSIKKEKEAIQKHITAIEFILEQETNNDKKLDLYLSLSSKLTKYYSLLQKHNEQLLDAIELSGGGKDEVPTFDE
jgi:uncharacterized protein (DUF2344 family)